MEWDVFVPQQQHPASRSSRKRSRQGEQNIHTSHSRCLAPPRRRWAPKRALPNGILMFRVLTTCSVGWGFCFWESGRPAVIAFHRNNFVRFPRRERGWVREKRQKRKKRKKRSQKERKNEKCCLFLFLKIFQQSVLQLFPVMQQASITSNIGNSSTPSHKASHTLSIRGTPLKFRSSIVHEGLTIVETLWAARAWVYRFYDASYIRCDNLNNWDILSWKRWPPRLPISRWLFFQVLILGVPLAFPWRAPLVLYWFGKSPMLSLGMRGFKGDACSQTVSQAVCSSKYLTLRPDGWCSILPPILSPKLIARSACGVVRPCSFCPLPSKRVMRRKRNSEASEMEETAKKKKRKKEKKEEKKEKTKGRKKESATKEEWKGKVKTKNRKKKTKMIHEW